jgi:hypothetical protein
MSEPALPVAVSRGVPPKRVKALAEIRYGGATYQEGDEFLIGEGATADNLALTGMLEIVDHNATDAWNGKEGDKIRKEALAAIDAQHKAEGSKRTHDHGFRPFTDE